MQENLKLVAPRKKARFSGTLVVVVVVVVVVDVVVVVVLLSSTDRPFSLHHGGVGREIERERGGGE